MRRFAREEFRSARSGDEDSAQGDEGWIASLRAELLPPLSSCRADGATDRYGDIAFGISLFGAKPRARAVMLEDALKILAGYTALGVEAIAVAMIAFGAIEATILSVSEISGLSGRTRRWRRDLFVRFGRWLLFGLQFALAADIVRTVIAPSWNDIGQLAAIAVIRTFLSHFLEKDMEQVDAEETLA